MSLFSVCIAYIHKIFSFLLSLASKSLILTNLTMTKLLNRLTGLKVAQSCSNQIHILCMTMRQNRVGSILFRISIFWRGDHERWLTKSSILMAKGRFFIVMRGTERLQDHVIGFIYHTLTILTHSNQIRVVAFNQRCRAV